MKKSKKAVKKVPKMGSRVVWVSQSGGCKTKKTGLVVKVLRAHSSARINFARTKASKKAAGNTAVGRARFHTSYFVLVPGKNKARKPILYWPRASKLKVIG